MERGDISVRAPEVSQQVQRLEAAQRATTKGVVFAAFLIGGIQLYLAGQSIYSWAMLAGAGVTLLSLLFSSRRK
jgi:hypothetical protein